MELLTEIFRDPGAPRDGKTIYREAVRGIIFDGRKLLMLHSPVVGDYKFPGGGVDDGETIEETLVREVREECGARVIQIAEEFGKIIEYAIPVELDYDLFKMASYYYVCHVEPELEEQHLEMYEEDLGMRPVWVDIDEAIRNNRSIVDRKDGAPARWVRRETAVLERVRQRMFLD